MKKEVTYRIASKERLVELLEKIGWAVRAQSSDGYYVGIYDNKNKYTGYRIVGNTQIENELPNFKGGLTMYLKDCKFSTIGRSTVCISGKDNQSIFLSFHNFDKDTEAN